LYSLRAGLHKTIRKGGTTLKKGKFDTDVFRGVLEPLDEINTWLDVESEYYDQQDMEKVRLMA
jgi:hypothetical protein